MGMEWRRGQLSAWLLKKKSGTSKLRMRQYNKRFFTLDFDSRVFFYSHAEGSRKVSSVIRFSDIMDVQMPERGGRSSTRSADSVDQVEKRPSMFRRSFTLGSSNAKDGAEQAHHFVTVVVRPSKTMELLCSSQMEAEQWKEALSEAMLCGRECGDEPSVALVGYECSGRDSDDEEAEAFRSVALAPVVSESTPLRAAQHVPTGAVAAAAIAAATAAVASPTSATGIGTEPTHSAGNAGYPQGNVPKAQMGGSSSSSRKAEETPSAGGGYSSAAPAAAAADAPEAVVEPAGAAEPARAATASSPATAIEEDEEEGAAPPPVKGTFLDFTVEPAEPEPLLGGGQGPAVGSTASTMTGMQEAVVETSGMFHASDFGFGADEATSSSGSAVSTPREGATDTFAALGSPGSLVAGSHPPAAGGAKVEGGDGGRVYKDRHEGLTLQERLANLEFSDDDDDDLDDPLGLKK